MRSISTSPPPIASTTSAATSPSYRFTLKTKLLQDYGFECPVSGGTEMTTARNADGSLDLYSIGSEGRLHVFTPKTESSSGWREERLPFHADAVTSVPQRDGIDKIFFAELTESPKMVSVYELARAPDGAWSRRAIGRLKTTDRKVYSVSGLSGLQDAQGDNVLVTALAAFPAGLESSCVAVFGKGPGTGALSLVDDQPVAATQVRVCGAAPGRLAWPNLLFINLFDGRLTVERGVRKGAILQSEPLPIPRLDDVVVFNCVRDRDGVEQIFAIDAGHRLFHLAQVDGAEGEAPQWAAEWRELRTVLPGGRCPTLDRLHAVSREDGGLELFLLDEDDHLWHLSERRGPLGRHWSPLLDLGVHAAHLATGIDGQGRVQLFAVTRKDQLLWLRQVEPSSWVQRKIAWRGTGGNHPRNVYRTNFTLRDTEGVGAPEVPILITATDRLPMTINGRSYAVGPEHPLQIPTNSLGQINISFEWDEPCDVPTLNLEADFLCGGLLAVCPARQVQIYVRRHRDPRHDASDSTMPKIYLIPEGTEVRPS